MAAALSANTPCMYLSTLNLQESSWLLRRERRWVSVHGSKAYFDDVESRRPASALPVMEATM